MQSLMASAPVSDMGRRSKEVLAMLQNGPVALYQRSDPAAVMVLPSTWNSVVQQVDELEAKVAAEALVLHPETLDAFDKIQEHRVSIGLKPQTIVDLIDRLIQVELDRVTDGSDFSAATYELGKLIMERNDADGSWIDGDEFEERVKKLKEAHVEVAGANVG